MSDDDDGGIGVVFEKGNSGVDKDVDALLRANATKDPDAVFAGEAEFVPGRFFVGRCLKSVEIDSVGNDHVGLVFKIGGGGGTS